MIAKGVINVFNLKLTNPTAEIFGLVEYVDGVALIEVRFKEPNSRIYHARNFQMESEKEPTEKEINVFVKKQLPDFD